jgi:hypothetical protein
MGFPVARHLAQRSAKQHALLHHRLASHLTSPRLRTPPLWLPTYGGSRARCVQIDWLAPQFVGDSGAYRAPVAFL